jgi:two-component system NtrC family sensor kinase
MNKKSAKRVHTEDAGRKLTEDFRALSHKVLHYASRGVPRIYFMQEVCKMLLDFSGCDAVELRIKRREKYFVCQAVKGIRKSFRIEHLPCAQVKDGRLIPCSRNDSGLERLCEAILLKRFDPSLPFFTRNGSFWTGDVKNSSHFSPKPGIQLDLQNIGIDKDYKSMALFPLVPDEDNMGLLKLQSKKRNYFTKDEIGLYEGFAQTLGVALVHRTAQVALRERIKELTCLYGIARLSAQSNIALEEILQRIADILPPSWLYPEIASGKIVLDEHSYTTKSFQEGRHKQSADIIVGGKRRGFVQVTYSEDKPELDEGPFLSEERSLIDTIAREIALIIERRQAEDEKTKLQNQLMHADRLATIGQLAAGVAHELNEPLGNILGFAQLINKNAKPPQETIQDIEKIVNASLHAREIVKKLMIFAHQMPPHKTQVDLNQVVEEGLYFFESRCVKEGIELVRSLLPDLPKITADPGQLHQVLVNLVVNALQAMPKGGKLTVQTLADQDRVSLIVEDTGIGMDNEVMKQIFDPFFTTKDVGEGTGLGLSVVHGIVTSHRGTIKVESKVGRGSRFKIQLPISRPQEAKKND